MADYKKKLSEEYRHPTYRIEYVTTETNMYKTVIFIKRGDKNVHIFGGQPQPTIEEAEESAAKELYEYLFLP